MRSLLLFVLLAFPARAGAQEAPVPTHDDLAREFLWDRYLALPAELKPRTALVLSGGGARAMAHVGVLQSLERAGFEFDIVAGTSMGSLIGALYASGMSPAAIRETMPRMDIAQGEIFTPGNLFGLMFTGSLIASDPIQDFVKEAVKDKRFDQLDKPFGCVATDLTSGEKIIFREGPVAPAVRASMNMPGLLRPVEYRHRLLVDGGVVDYVPVDVAKLLGGEWILSSLTEGEIASQDIDNVFLTLQQVIDIRGSLLAQGLLKQSDVVVKPAAGHIGTFEFDKMEEAIRLGAVGGKAAAPAAQENLILRTLPAILK